VRDPKPGAAFPRGRAGSRAFKFQTVLFGQKPLLLIEAVLSPQNSKLPRAPAPEALDDPALTADLPTLSADWLEQVAANANRAAFARLFAFYGPRVKTYLLRLGLDADQAEALTLEVMVAVWRKAAGFDRSEVTAATWIFRIARNRSLDVLRLDQASNADNAWLADCQEPSWTTSTP